MRIRLTERCYFNKHLYQKGAVITLPKGVKGPHRSVRKTQETIDYATGDAVHKPGVLVDVPLYEVLDADDHAERHTPMQKLSGDIAAERSTAPLKKQPATVVPGSRTYVEPSGEVRQLTHIEERETWPGEIHAVPPAVVAAVEKVEEKTAVVAEDAYGWLRGLFK